MHGKTLLFLLAFLASCGGTIEDTSKQEQSRGDVVKTYNFPGIYTFLGDIKITTTGNWMFLAFSDLTCTDPTIVEVAPNTSSIIKHTAVIAPPSHLNCNSEMEVVGKNYYFTSYGWENTVPQGYIYKVDENGQLLETFPCPATTEEGFCEGIAWDGTNFWSGTADTTDLTEYTENGAGVSTIAAVVGLAPDVAFDSTKNRLVSASNTIYTVDLTARISSKLFGLNGITKGDYNADHWFEIDNANKVINKIYIK